MSGNGNEIIFCNITLRNKPQELYFETDLEKWFVKIKTDFQAYYDELDHVVHLNWSLHKIVEMELHINKFSPLKGGFYFDLPSTIKYKKACINPQNDDEFCFKYAIVPKELENTRNAFRMSHYTEELMQKYEFKGLTFPTPLNEIHIFERNNNASVNVRIRICY